ncbi:MAG: formate--tetrahydrofolate ligase [Thermovirga sp.]|jgi:formate--tetrahydrofolate ligase|nr:formate--tetrahydrofolate ligase [Thermovirga sp.]MDN5368205.1 formate--tetrahydrofolate ligase [Thermovirga sp.]
MCSKIGNVINKIFEEGNDMLSDIQIAQQAELKPIGEIAEKLGIPGKYVIPYGHTKAKIDLKYYSEIKDRPDGKLILVTATTPTPAGEGKTTTTIGLTQALVKLGKKAMLCLREPSLGPCFGVKGGAAGGGYSQVLPMEDINLHFTGDIHAVSTAHNLLAAMLDNHLQQGNELGIDPRRITFRRVVDMNDRALRNIVIGLGGKAHGIPRESGFDISVSSEIMAILCLATDLQDLKERLGNIVVGYTWTGEKVTARDLKAHGAMAALLKDAINPNLVQTIEHVPAFVHGGPFANIAHGTNSIVATKMALKLTDYTVVEAGFAADLGAEKFMDIVCRKAGFSPSAVVLVTTVRALKMHGGVPKDELGKENLEALEKGAENLEAHIDILKKFGVPVVVALNRFTTDTDAEIQKVHEAARRHGATIALSEVWAKGGEGGIELAKAVLEALDKPCGYRPLYELELPLREKIETIAREVYGADGVDYTPAAESTLKELEANGYGNLPVCMAKTQMSISDDPAKKGRPKGYRITVREVRLSAGAGFIVPICGSIMTMPGLPKKPAAEIIDIDENGNILNLF